MGATIDGGPRPIFLIEKVQRVSPTAYPEVSQKTAFSSGKDFTQISLPLKSVPLNQN